MAGVAGFEPTNDGVRDRFTTKKISKNGAKLPKNSPKRPFFRAQFFSFPN